MPIWMLYGATGITGRMLAAEAARRGPARVLAGRNREHNTTMCAEVGQPRALPAGVSDRPDRIGAGRMGALPGVSSTTLA